MLANLTVRRFDKAVQRIADQHDLIFTRMPTDITLSSVSRDMDRARCGKVIGLVYREMARYGLSPNITKTRLASPGSRKVVLGLLVDGKEPASRESSVPR